MRAVSSEDVYAGFASYDLNLDSTFIQLLQQHKEKLCTYYAVDNRHKWPEDSQTRAEAPVRTDSKLAYIYIEKMSPALQEAFVCNGLALADYHVDENGYPNDVGRVGMHPKLAAVYMTALAEEMAASRGYHPVTDETVDHLAISGCTLERLAQALLGTVDIISKTAPTELEIEVQMATIAFESVLPQHIAAVPTKKIIAFRERHAAERAAFQNHLHKMMAELGGWHEIKDRDALQIQLETLHGKYLKPQVDEYRRCLNDLGIDTVMGALNVRAVLPLLVTSVAELAGITLINPLLGVGGAIAFSVLPVIRDKQKEARDLKRSYPVAYLMNVEENLRAASLMQWVAERPRQFFFRV